MHHYDVVFFDCDSTLIAIESLDVLGERMGVGKEVREMTARSMGGEESFEHLFKKKIDLMRPHEEDVEVVASLCVSALVPGALDVVAALHREGKRVYIVSSNFHTIVDTVADALGIPRSFVLANDIFFDADGAYAGIDENSPLCRNGGKPEMVRRHVRSGERSVFVGDGMTDAATKNVADLFIGFGGVVEREAVRMYSDVYVVEPDLRSILEHIL